MRMSYYKLIVFICTVIFLTFIRSTEAYEVFTYDDPDDLTALWTDLSFDDGTIILNFIKPINATCMEPTFYYRIIHLNGTVVPLTINIPDIEQFNFCVGAYKTHFNTPIDIPTEFGITKNINPEEGFIVTKITDNIQEYIQEWVTYKAP